MANHRRPSSAKKVTPTVIVVLAVLSIGTPLVSLLGSIRELTVQPTTDTQQIQSVLTTPLPPSQSSAATSTAPTRPSEPLSTAHTPPKTSTAQRPVQGVPSSTERHVQQPTRTPTSPTPARTVITKTLAPPPPKTVTETATATATATATKTVTKMETKTETETETVTQPAQVRTRSHAQLVQVAQKYVGRGIPYVMGGNDLAKGMDCSHFVWMVLKEVGYSTGYRNSESLAKWTKRTTKPQLGDLVLYHGHVGIYADNGMMIEHGRNGGAFLTAVYKDPSFIGYGRIPL